MTHHMGPNAADIAGYTYCAENYSTGDIIDAMISAGELSPAARDMSVEDALDQHAAANGIDRRGERSFDSSEHPKIILWSQVDMSLDWEWLGEEPPMRLYRFRADGPNVKRTDPPYFRIEAASAENAAAELYADGIISDADAQPIDSTGTY